ncbi:hypothetical protein PhCBS80983_g06495 [Powellomyces hirtus]|uniref:Cof-like hydrolase n=1 Tax=Powellomyces hirtus TaxID=109895 RepID=A0A507DL03_9FUNG|nr:hypothetical protein PhCBS80983_g06495 [Powellomyces hirtus]
MNCSTIDASAVKLIVSDVDGTLLDNKHELHPRNEAAILKIRKQYPDIPFVIATGKPFGATADIRKKLGLSDSPAIHTNGCLLYQNGHVTKEFTLDPSVVLDIVEMGRKDGKAVYLYVKDEVFQAVEDPAGRGGRTWFDVMKSFGEDIKLPTQALLQSVESGEIGVQKIVLLSDEKYVPDVRQKLTDNWGQHFHLTQALSYAIELLPHLASKSLALAELLPLYDITSDNVLVFGDGENDASMLKMAKYGVAMANAMPVAKDSASYRTLSNDEGGVGAALEVIFKL